MLPDNFWKVSRLALGHHYRHIKILLMLRCWPTRRTVKLCPVMCGEWEIYSRSFSGYTQYVSWKCGFLIIDRFLQALRSKLYAMQTDQPEWLKKVVTYQDCPKCKSGQLSTRVPQSFFYKHIIFWADYKRYRCDQCNNLVHIGQ
jgi:hypothetical protein